MAMLGGERRECKEKTNRQLLLGQKKKRSKLSEDRGVSTRVKGGVGALRGGFFTKDRATGLGTFRNVSKKETRCLTAR